MSFNVAVGLLVVAGGAFSAVSLLFRRFAESLWYRLAGGATWLGLLINLAGRFGQPTMYHLMMVLITCPFWVPFGVMAVTDTIFTFVRGAVGLDNLKVPPSYSHAEGAEAQRDFEGALKLYRKATEEYPEEAEPWRRMAELHLKADRPDEAVAAFREAEARQGDAGEKLVTVFAIAETLADLKGDPAAAVRELETFLAAHPEVEGRSFAEDRLQVLRARCG